jgi:hypothetical protein
MRSRGACGARAAVAAALLLAGIAAQGSAEPVVVERILAVVDGRPLLLSEVEVLERVRAVDRAAALEAAIDERLMYQDASRSPQAALSAAEAQAALDSVVARMGPAASEVGRGELATLARREAIILKYVHLRFLPQVRIDDEAVRRAYEAETAGLGTPPSYEEAAPGLRKRLADRDLDERIEGWVRELRSSADVRYNVER